MSIERTVRSADGLALFVREWPAEQAAQGPLDLGTPVLCLHGISRNSRDFELVAPRLAALGRRTIAMDVRGRGRSDFASASAHYQVPVYAQDALRVLDELGVEKAVLLGTSMGGLITTLVAQAAPQRLAGAILNDIGPAIDPRGISRIAGYLDKIENRGSLDEAAAAIALVQGVAYPGADAQFWRTMARRTFRQRADGRFEPDYDPAISASLASAQPVDYAAAFRCLAPIPTLVLRGAMSDILSRDGVRVMQELKPDVEVLEVPNVGHAPTLEEPSAWLPIVDFLARVA